MFGLSLRRRHHREIEQDDMTPTRRDQLAILTVAGTSDMEQREIAKHRLMFAYELARQGKIGEGDDDR